MKGLIEKFSDGGPIFTYTILLLLIVLIALFVKAIIEQNYDKKSQAILASIGWLALAWGYMGRTFGLIMGFDNIAAAGEIAPQHLAGGIKMAILGPMFGITVFIFARLGILILQLKSKKEDYV